MVCHRISEQHIPGLSAVGEGLFSVEFACFPCVAHVLISRTTSFIQSDDYLEENDAKTQIGKIMLRAQKGVFRSWGSDSHCSTVSVFKAALPEASGLGLTGTLFLYPIRFLTCCQLTSLVMGCSASSIFFLPTFLLLYCLRHNFFTPDLLECYHIQETFACEIFDRLCHFFLSNISVIYS